MKEVKHYICEICNTEYNEKAKAQQCEKSHHTPKEIVSMRYLAHKNDASGYPIEIMVKMSDGKEVRYKR